MAHTSLKKQYADWLRACKETVADVVPPVMKDKMVEAVEYEVYARYSPTSYDRRMESGGLSDKDNMVHRIDIKGNRIDVILYNNTLGNSDYEYSSNDYIDKIIITGEGYTWKGSNIYNNPIERDFYSKTEELLNDGELRHKIIASLRSKGLFVE